MSSLRGKRSEEGKSAPSASSSHVLAVGDAGVRRERCGFRGLRHQRRGPPCRAGRRLGAEAPPGPAAGLSAEDFILRIVEAEPPAIYLMEEQKKPFTEAGVMMSLINLADKELVLMISWAKKIPGESALAVDASSRGAYFKAAGKKMIGRLRGAEPVRPDPAAQVLLVGDPHAGPDVAIGRPSREAHLLARLQARQVSERPPPSLGRNSTFFCKRRVVVLPPNQETALDDIEGAKAAVGLCFTHFQVFS